MGPHTGNVVDMLFLIKLSSYYPPVKLDFIMYVEDVANALFFVLRHIVIVIRLLKCDVRFYWLS